MEPQLTACKNCNHLFTGRYCNNCGEKIYTDHDRSLFHFFEEGFHFITHFDGKFFNTLRVMFTRPGRLSDNYCGGIRKRYFKPLSLFLLLVVVYLLFPVFEGLNMRMSHYLTNSFYGGYATRKVQALMTTHHLSMQQLTELFAHKSEKVSKFLLPVLILGTALFFWLFTFRRRGYFFDQMVFSSEVNSFFLLWGFMLFPLLLGLIEVIAHAVSGRYIPMSDAIVGPILYTVLCSYVAIAARRFYKLTAVQAIALALLFAFMHGIIVQGLYKFLLFVIVTNQIH